MKSSRRRLFWSLSPTAAAQSLERSCWLAAAGLVLSLALGIGPAVGASARPSAAAPPEDPHLLILQRRCIDRILSQAVDKTEDDVISRINQQCMTPPRSRPASAPRLILLACERPVSVRFGPVTKRVAGCLRG
jgi:hypothetical protein